MLTHLFEALTLNAFVTMISVTWFALNIKAYMELVDGLEPPTC